MSLATKIGTGIFLVSSYMMTIEGTKGVYELYQLREEYPRNHIIVTDHSTNVLERVLFYFTIGSVAALGTINNQLRRTNSSNLDQA